MRESDLAACTGGDEFIVVLQDVDDEGAARTSRRIIDAIAVPVALGLPTELMISVSIGSAFAPRDARQADLLLSRADQALYAAKRAERGAYRSYNQLPRPAPGPALVVAPS